MGFPTANIIVPEDKFVVKRGVYVSRVKLGQRILYGVTNIGRRPTLEDAVNDVAETYIFDFDEDIYGAKLEIELLHFLRPESKMTSKEELINAVNLNKKQALEYIKNLDSAVN
jgi:riboflavin kinase/FMN adenylyltransferase